MRVLLHLDPEIVLQGQRGQKAPVDPRKTLTIAAPKWALNPTSVLLRLGKNPRKSPLFYLAKQKNRQKP